MYLEFVWYAENQLLRTKRKTSQLVFLHVQFGQMRCLGKNAERYFGDLIMLDIHDLQMHTINF